MKVLLVRTSSMGDLIHTLPAIEDLSRHRPDIQLHWLCEEAFSDIARLHPFVRKIHLFSWRQWRKKLFSTETRQHLSTLKKALMAEKFDLVLDSQGLLKSAIPAKLMTKAPMVGLHRKSAKEPLASFFYQKTIQLKKNHNMIWQNRQLFAETFAYTVNHTEVQFGAKVPENIVFPIENKPYHVCIHAASRPEKLWPEALWIELMQRIHAQTGHHIYLTWGSEEEYHRSLRLAENTAFVHICPRMSLIQAASLLQNAESVVGVDTGLFHLGNVFSHPSVGIYTDSPPEYTAMQFSPYEKNIGGIGVIPPLEDVWNLWREVVENKRNK